MELVPDSLFVEGVSSAKLKEWAMDINRMIKFKRIAATIIAPNVSDTSIRSVKYANITNVFSNIKLKNEGMLKMEVKVFSIANSQDI